MKRIYNQAVFFTLLPVLLLTANAYAQEQITFTWTGAINHVVMENPNLASSEANLEAMRKNIDIARANYLPGFNLLGEISKSKAATFSSTSGILPASSALVGGSLSQMVYNEQYLANFKIQKYLFASEEQQLKNTLNNTVSAAGTGYIGLLFAVDLLGVLQENLQITRQNLNGSRDRLEAGSTNRQEVLRWETQMYADQQAVESQKAVVIIKQGSLNQLLNMPIETKQYLEKLTIEKNGFIFSSDIVDAAVNDENKALLIRDYLVELGLAKSPVLAGLDQQLLAQNRLLEANSRWAIPNFNFSAGADAKFNLDKDNAEEISSDKGFWKVGLTMYYPILDGGAHINKVKQSRFQMSALELQREDIKTSLEQSIRASVAVVISDYINIGLTKSQADAAQQNYDLVNDAYLIGESSLLDFLDAQNQKLGADISSRVSLYTFFEDLLAVEKAISYFPFLEPQQDVSKIIDEVERSLLEVK